MDSSQEWLIFRISIPELKQLIRTQAKGEQAYNQGKAYLDKINKENLAAEASVLADAKKGYEMGVAELKRAGWTDAMIEANGKAYLAGIAYLEQIAAGTNNAWAAVVAQGKVGYDMGMANLIAIANKTAADAKARDEQAQKGYDQGKAYLKQCGWTDAQIEALSN